MDGTAILGRCCDQGISVWLNKRASTMLGHRSNPTRPTGQVLPLSALLALNLEEQPGNEAMEQELPAPQMPPVAAFPQEESHPAPNFFAADTAFDCEDGDAAWAAFAD
jgi:hypothetical protein